VLFLIIVLRLKIPFAIVKKAMNPFKKRRFVSSILTAIFILSQLVPLQAEQPGFFASNHIPPALNPNSIKDQLPEKTMEQNPVLIVPEAWMERSSNGREEYPIKTARDFPELQVELAVRFPNQPLGDIFGIQAVSPNGEIVHYLGDDLSELSIISGDRLVLLQAAPSIHSEEEVSISNNGEHGLTIYFEGVQNFLRRELIKQIQKEPPPYTSQVRLWKETEDEVTFFVRNTGSRRKPHRWAFSKRDIPKVARQMGWTVRNLENPIQRINPKTEVSVSQNTEHGVGQYFLGSIYRLKAELREAISEEAPNKHHEKILWPDTDYEVRLISRRIGTSQAQWVFRVTNLPKVEKMMGWYLKSKNKQAGVLDPNREVSVSANLEHGLIIFYGGIARGLTKALLKITKEEAPPVHTEKILWPKSGHEVRLVSKHVGNGYYRWTFLKSDIPKVGKAMGWQIRNFDNPAQLFDHKKEISISGNLEYGLSAYVIGHVDSLSKKLNKQIGEDAPNYHKEIILWGGTEDQVIFTSRRVGKGRYIWTFLKSDLPKVLKKMGWKSNKQDNPARPFNPKKEVSLSPSQTNGLRAYFNEGYYRLRDEMKQEIDTKAPLFHQVKILWQETPHQIHLTSRATGYGHFQWAFDKMDIPKVAEKMGWRIRNQEKKPQPLMYLLLEKPRHTIHSPHFLK